MYVNYYLLHSARCYRRNMSSGTKWFVWKHIWPEIERIQKFQGLLDPMYQIRSDQSLSRVRLFATPWTTARQASLSMTSSRSSPRLMSIESVMSSSHLILCRPLLLLPPIPPSIRVFSNQSTLRMSGQNTGVSALTSFLPKKSQGWSPSEWTCSPLGLSLQSKGLSRVFSNTTVQKY